MTACPSGVKIKKNTLAEGIGMAEYYKAYDERYKKVKESGAGIWGTSENDPFVTSTLEKWVRDNSLAKKSVLQCACGEGSEGIILSRLGCLYWGTDVSVTAVNIARERLEEYPGARIFFMDMVKNSIAGKYDGIVDCQGLHMLVTDDDRRKYLENLYSAMKDGASAIFIRELCDDDAFSGSIGSFEEWQSISGADCETPEERTVNGTDKTVMLTRIPARSKSREGYIKELEAVGFKLESFERESDTGLATFVARK